MPVLMVMEAPGATLEQYERVAELTGTRTEPPEGLISHQAGATDEALFVVDVWESEEALRRFVESGLREALAEVGIDASRVAPRVAPVHNLVAQGAGTRPGVILMVDLPGFTTDQYDAMVAGEEAHRDGGRHHPAVSHVAAVTDGGMLVVDVWDSPEAFERFFREEISPSATEALPPVEPRVVPVHNRMLGRAAQPAA